MKSRRLTLGSAALLVGSSASSEIYEWRDAGGARHFTNQKVRCRSLTRHRHASWCGHGPPSPGRPVLSRILPRGQRCGRGAGGFDAAGLRRGVSSAVRDALAATVRENYGRGGSVNIVGPLAIARTDVAPPLPSFAPYPAFVTTSFDRGRSRHLTLRMFLQDQFQLDRDGPFTYERIPPVGLGPNLDPFLPRGLPHRFVRSRVLYR